MLFVKNNVQLMKKSYILRRLSKLAKKKRIVDDDTKAIRNIGILAHIDAGKTTTTERMLFFSGTISHMGEVHHGNTVTDFMEQERERGITITSASVTFDWGKHKINLLDTPGHIDFTMEVEQTLSVMDGAVVILDGSAGVEAQTVTVWKQADRYNIPRIVYINKMDKLKADLHHCQDSVLQQLNIKPLVLQMPIFNKANIFKGVVDLLNLEKYEWNDSSVNFTKTALNSADGKLWEDSLNARIKLIESAADLDDSIAEMIINDENKLESMSSATLQNSLKKITLEQKGVVLLCGSSYKNIGVQCLLDAVVDYLPSPSSSNSQRMMQWFDKNLCAKAFKVRHDEFKGPITFFRIYSGNMYKGQKLFNINKGKIDNCEKLYIAYADDYEEVTEIGPGNICAATGLKFTNSGELVTYSANIFASVQKSIKEKTKKHWNEVLPCGVVIPDPVFFCSIEAPSLRYQTALDKALSELEREDSSLKITVNGETGQTILGGMGELHIEVIRDRIRKEYKIDAELGELQIAYKEKLIKTEKETHSLIHEINNNHYPIKITMSTVMLNNNNVDKLSLDMSPETVENISSISPKYLAAIRKGVHKALLSGPKLQCPVLNVGVMLHWLEVGKATAETLITAATVQCIKKLLSKGGTILMEPIMLLEIVCGEKEMISVINDLGRRRCELCETVTRGSDYVIKGLAPLSELRGYAKELRILTSGRATLSMEQHSLRAMDLEEELKAIKRANGF